MWLTMAAHPWSRKGAMLHCSTSHGGRQLEQKSVELVSAGGGGRMKRQGRKESSREAGVSNRPGAVRG
jgi:hypothetical protein